MATFYVGTRMPGAAAFRVSLDAYPIGWAEDVATLLREYGTYAEVRVFPAAPVDRLVAAGAVQVVTL